MAANQFMVFGYDVRDYGRLWLSAWRDFLLGDDSPVRAIFDSAVLLEFPDGEKKAFHCGQPVASSGPTGTVHQTAIHETAMALPEELVLSRTLKLPAAAETELDAALCLEIAASSPFAVDDTAAGWRIFRQEDSRDINVDLVIVSRSAVMSYLGESKGIHDPLAREIWAPVSDRWVTMRGFGESTRELGYTRRIVRSGIIAVICVLLVLAIIGTSTALSGRRVQKLEAIQAAVRSESKAAMQLRDRLAEINGIVAELNELNRRLPSPQLEIARLTELLPDSAYVTQYTQTGNNIRIRGLSTDGATLQQELTKVPTYQSVKATQAISRVGNSGLEQFFLDLELKSNR
jgi:general secretion pathway protein L